LQRPRITDCGRASESERRRIRVRARTEVAIQRDYIDAIGDVERLEESLNAEMIAGPEKKAQPQVAVQLNV